MKFLRNIVVALFILAGCMEAIWGLGQLYGFVLSRHALFAMTGSFYNPGPYSGFLAMIFPIACPIGSIPIICWPSSMPNRSSTTRTSAVR